MDLDRIFHILVGLSILSFLIAGIAILGEVRGWWNDAGQIAITVATLAGVGTSVAAFLTGASRDQAKGLAELAVDTNAQVHTANGSLEQANGKLDQMNGKLDQANGKLDQTVEGLGDANAKLDQTVEGLGDANGKLDQVNDTLGRTDESLVALVEGQKGQTELLAQIRDRL